MLSLGVAGADPQDPTMQAAGRHHDSGVEFFKNGDYESARIEFEAAFLLSKKPDVLVNLCIVADKQNRVREAANYCEQYLRLRPDAADGDEVRVRLERLRQQQTQAEPPAKPAAPHSPPASATSPSPPASAASPAATVPPPQTSVSMDATASPRLALVKAAERPAPPKPALVLLVGGAALFWGGVGTGAAALVTAREIQDGPLFTDLAGLQQRGDALNAAAITLYVVGGVAVAAGAGWLGYWRAHHRAARSALDAKRPYY